MPHEKSATWKKWNMESTRIVNWSAEIEEAPSTDGLSVVYLGPCKRSITEHFLRLVFPTQGYGWNDMRESL